MKAYGGKPFVYVSTSISLVDNSREFPTQSYEFVQVGFLSDLCFGRVREHKDENGNNRNVK
jgi:ribosome biogenesis protein Nip4